MCPIRSENDLIDEQVFVWTGIQFVGAMVSDVCQGGDTYNDAFEGRLLVVGEYVGGPGVSGQER